MNSKVPMSRPVQWRRLALIAVVTLFGCPAALSVEHGGGDFVPEVVFAGRLHGEGTLRLGLGRARAFQVDSIGTMQADGGLRVDQRVRFADGTAQSRHWVLRRARPGAYLATLSDARGPVAIRIKGRRLLLDYRLKPPGASMHQVLELAADGRSIANIGSIRFLGIPIGRLDETIRLQPVTTTVHWREPALISSCRAIRSMSRHSLGVTRPSPTQACSSSADTCIADPPAGARSPHAGVLAARTHAGAAGLLADDRVLADIA